MQVYFRLISFLILLLFTIKASAQGETFPKESGDKVKFTALIEMPKAYLSGVCILSNEEHIVTGCIFNEFGVTGIEFMYNETKDKVKLRSVLPMLNRWYIKLVLKKDLLKLIHTLKNGETTYLNEKRNIKYSLTPLVEITNSKIELENDDVE